MRSAHGNSFSRSVLDKKAARLTSSRWPAAPPRFLGLLLLWFWRRSARSAYLGFIRPVFGVHPALAMSQK
jgi:hypothetical protein